MEFGRVSRGSIKFFCIRLQSSAICMLHFFQYVAAYTWYLVGSADVASTRALFAVLTPCSATIFRCCTFRNNTAIPSVPTCVWHMYVCERVGVCALEKGRRRSVCVRVSICVMVNKKWESLRCLHFVAVCCSMLQCVIVNDTCIHCDTSSYVCVCVCVRVCTCVHV